MRSHKLTRRSDGFSLIELLIVISIIGIMAAVAIPQLNAYLKRGRETAAIQSLQEIHRAQASFYSTKGKYASLNDLVEGEFLRRTFGEGKTISGYKYSSSEVSTNTFTIHADRVTDGDGYSDFNITEKGDVYKLENKTKGTVARGEGQLVGETEASDAKADSSPAAK
jgi:prepilin-type N-terminal cleavage/methylation domain-containing protein